MLSSVDNCYTVNLEITSDGGVLISAIMIGTESDMIVAKISSAGSVEWSRKIGDAQDDGIGTVKETNDGNFILVGKSKKLNVGGFYNVVVMKLDSLGQTIWATHIDKNGEDFTSSVLETANGDFLVAGAII